MRSNNRILRRNVIAVAVVAVSTLAACDKGGAEKKSGQSVARVDGHELTVHQLNSELSTVSQAPGANEAALKSQALDSIINRRLLVAEAERAKIDHDPEVMQAIDRQKEQVLVQALLQRKATEVAKPTADEVRSFYQANPALFANRRVYDMHQTTISADSMTPELQSFIDSSKSMDEVNAWLEKNNVSFSSASASRTTADLPMQIVNKLGDLGNGKIFIVKEPTSVMIASLHLVKETPVSEEAARPQIEQYLANKKLRDLANTEITRLRSAAKIEYLDPTIAPANAELKKQLAESSPDSAPKLNDAVSKGASGLK